MTKIMYATVFLSIGIIIGRTSKKSKNHIDGYVKINYNEEGPLLGVNFPENIEAFKHNDLMVLKVDTISRIEV